MPAKMAVVDPSEKEPGAIYDPANTLDISNDAKIGAKTYHLHEVPIARIKRFRKVWLLFFERFNGVLGGADLSEQEASDALFSLLEEAPFEMLSVVVPDLDPSTFEDEDNGATFPQLKAALDIALRVNGLEFLKQALPFVISTMRMGYYNRARGEAQRKIEELEARAAALAETTETEVTET